MNIGLDCDGVLANFQQGFIEKARAMGVLSSPAHWTQWDVWFPPSFNEFGDVWEEIEHDHEFWLSLPPYDDAYIDFEVAAYVTARPIPSEVSAEWIRTHGFPEAEVVTVGVSESKVSVLRDLDIDLFIDDKVETVEEVNEAGILCLLRDRPYNEYAEHLPRIRYFHHLKELIEYHERIAS